MTTPTLSKNSNLHSAKRAKNDEFYTQLSDIENELRHYRDHFRDKTVYLNCDDPRESQFFRYFSLNFEFLGLKRLIATSYAGGINGEAVFFEYLGDTNGNGVPDPHEIAVTPLKGDGDFRSEESLALLAEADIVVSNPPFSLFREYVAQMIENDKKFLIIGNQNAITYKEIFPLIQRGAIWLGAKNGAMEFQVSKESPSSYERNGLWYQKLGNIAWLTNLDHAKRHEELILVQRYTPDAYPTYDNYDAIEVSKVVNIPEDYDGVMGVPISFLDKWNPDQFEIVGIAKAPLGEPSKVYPQQIQVSANGVKSKVSKLNDGPAMKVDVPPAGKTYYEVDGGTYVQLYARILIRKKAIQ